MSAQPSTHAVIVRTRGRGIVTFVPDTLLLTRRHLLRTARTPQIIVLSAIMPIMFVLLFRYVFGGSIQVPGYSSYVDYLIPGIIVQTALFGGSSSAVGVAEELSKGTTDRFRSLPTNRAAILASRTLADMIRLGYTMALVIVVGLLVGFQFHNGLWPTLGGFAIALLFGYACAWLFTLLGLTVRSVEGATLAGFMLTFPLVFASSAFTATVTMPDWLRTFADAQPVTHVANALRALTHGDPAHGAILHAIVWSIGILVASAVLATLRFRKG
ncbi:ABC transporter permease [Candidatus Solirubrobacter pratensis]|uniref:ABC transporter permease n=1 Tax=Candidatus Solirubrobacter pratensis TaxID=1298857 RepID=UPI0009DBA346|nr:ABC transporter permease [Candidatus Solirubrobacter pratensis]